MNEATKELTLADFQQQVAEKYGFENIGELVLNAIEWNDRVPIFTAMNEAAEAYAAYCREQGKQEGEAVSERSKLLNCKFCKSQHVYRYTCGNMVGFAKCKDCKKEFEI